MTAEEHEDAAMLQRYGLEDMGEGVDPYAVRGAEHLSSDMQRLIHTFLHRPRPEMNTFPIAHVPPEATWGVDNNIDVLCINNDPVSICVIGRVVPPMEVVDEAGSQPFISLQALRHRDLVAARILQGQRSNPEVVSTAHVIGLHRWRANAAHGRIIDLSGQHTGANAEATLRSRGLVVGDTVLVQVQLVRVRVNCLTWRTWTTIFHLGPVFLIDPVLHE